MYYLASSQAKKWGGEYHRNAKGLTPQAIGSILGDRAGKNLIRISDYTGQPEMQGGLVKTLDFKIYLGLLSETYNQDHAWDLARVQGITFDMVVANLYPFFKTIREPGLALKKQEQISISADPV